MTSIRLLRRALVIAGALVLYPSLARAQEEDPADNPRRRPPVTITADVVERFLRAHAAYERAVQAHPEVERYDECRSEPPADVEALQSKIDDARAEDDSAKVARLERAQNEAWRRKCGAPPTLWADGNPYRFAERIGAAAGGFKALGDYLLVYERIDALVSARRYDRPNDTDAYRFTAAERAAILARYAALNAALTDE